MKTFAIVNGSVIETTYQSNEVDFKRFGGPWGRPEEREHLEVPENLKDTNITDLEARFKDVMVGCQGTPKFDGNGKPVMELAFDEADEPIMGSDGNQALVQAYDTVHIMENKKVICLKS